MDRCFEFRHSKLVRCVSGSSAAGSALREGRAIFSRNNMFLFCLLFFHFVSSKIPCGTEACLRVIPLEFGFNHSFGTAFSTAAAAAAVNQSACIVNDFSAPCKRIPCDRLLAGFNGSVCQVQFRLLLQCFEINAIFQTRAP